MLISPKIFHDQIAKNAKHVMAFDKQKNFFEQKRAVKNLLTDLIGMPEGMGATEPLVEYDNKTDPRFDEIRFIYESEPRYFVPAHLLTPKEFEGKLPVVICLQGHSTGMHNSIGRTRFSGDEEGLKKDRDFAVQAVKRGFAAICIEQRGFGEMNDLNGESGSTNCAHMASQALIMGRTLLGERCRDISSLIDCLPFFEQLNVEKIGLMGNSGGGTATFYAACMDERIKVLMPSCSLCPYYDSIITIRHCPCNYIPGIFKYLEMPDLTILTAPRPVVVVAGEKDEIFPIGAVKKGYETIKAIYKAAGAPEACRLVIGGEGHRFYAQQSWPVFESFMHNIK